VLGISEWHFRRLCDRYEAEGAEGLIDRHRGCASGRGPQPTGLTRGGSGESDRVCGEAVFGPGTSAPVPGGARLCYGHNWTKTILQSRALVAIAPRRSAHREKRPRRPLSVMMMFRGTPSRKRGSGGLWPSSASKTSLPTAPRPAGAWSRSSGPCGSACCRCCGCAASPRLRRQPLSDRDLPAEYNTRFTVVATEEGGAFRAVRGRLAGHPAPSSTNVWCSDGTLALFHGPGGSPAAPPTAPRSQRS
jgi:hypothetical protein